MSVFFFHSFHSDYDHIKYSDIYVIIKKGIFGNGNLGVNFFFVLSGFLITYLLMKENDLFGKIDVIRFWKRRILRIWPLFYFCVAFGFIAFPYLKTLFGYLPNESARPLYYVFFMNNFDFIRQGLPDASILGVLWSVAIEEQFYFVWPLLLFWLPTRSYPYLFSSVVGVSLLFRGIFDNPTYNEYHTLSCMSDMAVGALGAWLIGQQKVKNRIIELHPLVIVGLYVTVLTLFFFRQEILFVNWVMRTIERPILAFLFLAVILEQNYSKNSIFKLGNSKVMSYLGKITYGLYCLHFIGILIATTLTKEFHVNSNLWQVLILEAVIALMITIIMAMISYHYFESPFLKLKNKLSRVDTPQSVTL